MQDIRPRRTVQHHCSPASFSLEELSNILDTVCWVRHLTLQPAWTPTSSSSIYCVYSGRGHAVLAWDARGPGGGEVPPEGLGQQQHANQMQQALPQEEPAH